MGIFGIIGIVGVTFVLKPQAASGNDLDYGCNLMCKDHMPANENAKGMMASWDTTCADGMKRCKAGESDFQNQCDYQTKKSKCECLQSCDAVGETVGVFLTGVALLMLGLTLGSTFMCGIIPGCCFAKDAVAVAPAVQAQPMMAQQGVVVAQPVMAVAQPMVK